MSRTTQDMPALTALRAVAALLVFVYHFPPYGHGYLLDVVISQGHVGVTVFFVLSGFLITLRYYRQFERGEGGLAEYFVRRAARILPLYYVVLTLTHVLSSGRVPLDPAHLPEWTLTQALFDAAPDDITVPTSWSLTVEECFYASAPLLFLAVAALRRRLGAVGGSLVVLATGVVGLHLAGSLVLRLTAAAGTTHLGFLSEELLLRGYTIFGRFPDFALGAGAALLYASGRVEATWQRRGGALWSTLAALGGAVLLVAAQALMVRDAADPTSVWRWNLLVALGSAFLVLALTCRHAPLSRLLAFPLFVYLGRISYALYLIQLTPLGKGLLLQVLPDAGGVSLLALYIGMNVVSALLFELVEEPGREMVLALWRGRPLRSTAARTPAAIMLAIVLTWFVGQHVLWTLSRMPLDEQRLTQTVGTQSPDVLTASVTTATADGREPRVRLPDSWKVGPAADRRAPIGLSVFVDGQPVPFLGARWPVTPEAAAYYRRPRTDYVSLQLATASARVTVVNRTPRVIAAHVGHRVTESPATVLGPLLALALGVTLLHRRLAAFAPRFVLALVSALATVWLVAGAHLSPWGPVALAGELAVLAWLARPRAVEISAPPELV